MIAAFRLAFPLEVSIVRRPTQFSVFPGWLRSANLTDPFATENPVIRSDERALSQSTRHNHIWLA